MTYKWRVSRSSNDYDKFSIDRKKDVAGATWDGMWNGDFASIENKFLKITKEEARMEELNNQGPVKSDYIQGLEQKVKDLTAQLESMKKLYEE